MIPPYTSGTSRSGCEQHSPSLSLSLPLSLSHSQSQSHSRSSVQPSATFLPPTSSQATIDSLTAQVSAIALNYETGHAELKTSVAGVSWSLAELGSVVSKLVDKVSQLECGDPGAMEEVLRENRELRAENARLSLQNRSSDVTRQLDRTFVSLPSITRTVELSPLVVDDNSSEQQESTSTPKQWTRGCNLRSKDQINPPDRY